jgi:hypothetical protein
MTIPPPRPVPGASMAITSLPSGSPMKDSQKAAAFPSFS